MWHRALGAKIGAFLMKIPREETRKSHEHETSVWWWDPETAAWWADCELCGEVFEADWGMAMRLERYAEDHVRATPSFISPSSP